MKKPSHRPARTGGRPQPPSAARTGDPFGAALAAHQAGRLDVAEAGYREVLRRDSNHPHANNNLAILLRAARRYEEAIGCYHRAIKSAPEDASIQSNLACLLADLNRAAEAEAPLRTALALRPDYTEAWFNLANVVRELRRTAEAHKAYERALRLKPGMAEAHTNLGDLYRADGQLSRAAECFAAALRLRPDQPEAVVNLGETLKDQGRLEEAITLLQKGLEHHPRHALMHSNLLFALHYTPAVPPDIIHLLWDERHARPLLSPGRVFANARDPDRRLRVGYVSPDFCTHSCAYFSEPLLAAHDRAAVELFAYSTSRRQDSTTDRFKTLVSQWTPLTGLDDAAAAARIEADRIDILVDLSGHTAHSRLLVFARKPAPVQLTWLGYPDTTGMAAMNYRFTDAVADPEGVTDCWHSERLVRLPRGFLVFHPLISAPVQEAPPAAANGHVTFGSFNNLSKVTPEVVRLWAELLLRLPGSRLVVKSRALGDPPTRERYARLFVGHGIGPERLDLLGRIEPAENHLRAYDRIDIGLDPFPYNGTTTTCEALWMGVPVVSRAGTAHVSRVGASLLTQCGLPELIAADEAGYLETALALARDLARLAGLRRTLRARLEASPLTDYPGFARAVEAAYRSMWRNWLAGGTRS